MKDYPEAVALVHAIIQKGMERGATVTGAITLLTAEERNTLFQLVAVPGTSFSIEGIAAAATAFTILSPKDQEPTGLDALHYP